MSCPICIETYNKTKRLKIKCTYCNEEVCKECVEKYILDSSEEPHCMYCKKQWNREVCTELFPKTFVTKTLKTFREKLLFEREKALLPATQSEVEKIKAIRAMEKRLGELEDEKWKITNQIYEAKETIRTIQYNGIPGKRSKVLFTMGCPNNECKGFVDTSWECGMCDTKVCKKCLSILSQEDHECKPEEIETAKMLLSTSRPCPSCKVPIFKINGCDQMFCTQCNTAFSWRTGEIARGVVHNPHYYAWLRNGGQGPRVLGDIQCGGTPRSHDVLAHIKKASFHLTDHAIKNILEMHREVSHMEYSEIPRFRNGMNDGNMDIRVRYMMNEMSEDNFKKFIQRRDKKNEKSRAMIQGIEMYVNVCGDLFRNILECNTHEGLYVILEQFQKIRLYYESIMTNIEIAYQCKGIFLFGRNWKWDIGKDLTPSPEELEARNTQRYGYRR